MRDGGRVEVDMREFRGEDGCRGEGWRWGLGTGIELKCA